MTTCEYIHDGGMTEPSEPCKRQARYEVVDDEVRGVELPILSCDWHVLELAYERNLTTFVVTDIRGEKQKQEEAEGQALDMQEDSAREDLF